jgi:GT2 family glycosyltransferase
MDYKFANIAVVIPVYNGEKYLVDCIESLERQTLLPDQIVCVDNASSDKSLEVLSKFQISNSKFKILSNNTNLGFARACNQGIEEAIETGADFVFLLNQDTICEPNCLEELVKVAQEGERVFAVQAMLLCWPEKDKIQTAGNKIHFLGFGYCGNYNYPKSKIKSQKFEEITYASGAGMLINLSVLKKIGFFDEDLFLYHEDLDLGLRAKILGYKILLAPKAVIYHKYIGGVPPHRWYWSERGRQIVLLKFYKIPTLILIFPAWLVMEIGVIFYSLATGWFYLKVKSYFSVLLQLPKTIKKRKEIQKLRKINDRELLKCFEIKFKFAGLEHPLLKYFVNPILGLWGWLMRGLVWW